MSKEGVRGALENSAEQYQHRLFKNLTENVSRENVDIGNGTTGAVGIRLFSKLTMCVNVRNFCPTDC